MWYDIVVFKFISFGGDILKKKISILLSLVLVFSTFASVSSAQEITYEGNHTPYKFQSIQVDGLNTDIKLSNYMIGKVSEEEMKVIVRQARAAGGGEVTIHNILPASKVKRAKRAWWDTDIDWSVVRSNISHDNPGEAQLIISVARGATKKLSSSVTKKIMRSISWEGGLSIPSGASSKVKSDVNEEQSRTYSKEETWTGPSEKSSYVSRIYYFTGFYDYGDFSVSGTGWPSGDSYGPYTGSYREPTYYTEWSRDIK